jgi:hypothetical protein
MNDKTIVVYCTYERSLGGGYLQNYSKYKEYLQQNLAVLFDNKTNTDQQTLSDLYNSTVVSYTPDDFLRYGFNKPINPTHRWGSHQNPNYFYAHFRMLLFYLKNQSFDYYWFFDDDVYFDGNLNEFLTEYDSHHEDFMAIQVFKKEDYEEFPFVSKINNRMGSHGSWLHFAPGPGDTYKSTSRHMGCFFPIVRYSNKAMKHLLYLHEQNYYGYSEGFVPTSLASDGFSVASMLDENDHFFIRPKTECKLTHKHDNFTWTWI